MKVNIEIQILKRIKKAKRGVLFFNDSFIAFGSSDAVRQALARLVKAGELDRVATGIYTNPEIDPVIGKVMPGLEKIAETIAKRDKARIIPTGAYALYRLGLTTQIPLNVVYLTDGAARKIKIGNRSITFKKISPKNVATWEEAKDLRSTASSPIIIPIS